MRPLGHEHDALVAEFGGLIEEGVERQRSLAPKAGVADGMEK
jgi:hypothetical protein